MMSSTIQEVEFTLRQESVLEEVTKPKFSTKEELKTERDKLLQENSRAADPLLSTFTHK